MGERKFFKLKAGYNDYNGEFMDIEELYAQAEKFVKEKFNLTPDRNDGRITILSIMKDLIEMEHNRNMLELTAALKQWARNKNE